MPGEKPKLYGDKQRPSSSKRKYLEDSDDSDTGNNTPPPKKPLRQKKARFDSPVVDLSDVESSPAKSESTTDRLSSLKQKISLKSDSCSVHLSPQSDQSDVETTPETSELVADRLSSLKQKVSHTCTIIHVAMISLHALTGCSKCACVTVLQRSIMPLLPLSMVLSFTMTSS